MRNHCGLLLLLGLAASARGHVMYILPDTFFPQRGAVFRAGFHVGDSFPESEVGGRIARLQNPRLIARGGAEAFRNLRTEGNQDLGDATAFASGELIAAVATTPTFIELDPAKFTAYLKEEGLSGVIQWRERNGESGKPGKERYSKYAKAILLSGGPDGFARHKVGYVIEILPEADPYSLKVGDPLPVRVLFRGQPAADLQIEAAWTDGGSSKTTVAGRTGPDGRLRVPLPAAGRWRLQTIKMERCADASVADWESFWASLTFEIRAR